MAGSEHGTVEGSSGVSRRDALKKGAVAGGVVLWATPVIQAIGISPMSVAHASHGPHLNCSLSHFDLSVDAGGVIYGLQYDPVKDAFQAHSQTSEAHCLTLGTFEEPTPAVLAAFNEAADPTDSSTSALCCLRFTIPAGYTFVQGAAKCGNNCVAATPVSGQMYDFCCPL